MKIIIKIIILSLYVGVVYIQQNYNFTLYASNNAGKTDSVVVGIDSLATNGIDVALGESLITKSNLDSTFALFILVKKMCQKPSGIIL